MIDRHRRRLGRRCRTITLDFGPTDDPTHGKQDLSSFHGYYDSHCYLPLVGTVDFLLGLLASGWTHGQVLENYPALSPESLQAVFAYASDVLHEEIVVPVRTPAA